MSFSIFPDTCTWNFLLKSFRSSFNAIVTSSNMFANPQRTFFIRFLLFNISDHFSLNLACSRSAHEVWKKSATLSFFQTATWWFRVAGFITRQLSFGVSCGEEIRNEQRVAVKATDRSPHCSNNFKHKTRCRYHNHTFCLIIKYFSSNRLKRKLKVLLFH